jgi:pyruvate,water dikinase
MGGYVLGFEAIDRTQVAVVGGKGAHLAELARIAGIRVPEGFCVTTDAFRRVLAEAPSLDDRLDRLSRLRPDDREAIGALSAEIRQTIEGIAMPDELAAAITSALDPSAAYAVRSSATAEDLPTASFAGQQDTYLNVVGPAAVLRHVSRCQAACGTASTTARSTWPSSCSAWSSRRHPASCSRPTPSRPTARSRPWRPSTASARPWSPAW